MAKVKVFTAGSPDLVEAEANKWIAQAAAKGANIIQIAAAGKYMDYILWILYEE